MNEPKTPHSDSKLLMDPEVWRSFAASFAQKWKEAVRARRSDLERENDRAID